MFDGKWDAKEAPDCWVIKNRKTEVLFSLIGHIKAMRKKLCFPQQSMQKRH